MASRTLLVTGVSEAELGQRIAALNQRYSSSLQVRLDEHCGVVHLQLTSADAGEAARYLDEMTEACATTLAQDLAGVEVSGLAEVVLARLEQAGATLAAAESCTGGLISAWLTEVPGSSVAFRGGAVTYSNEAKEDLVSVEHALLVEHGAVSEPVARAMAQGVRQRFAADWGLGVTGIAGPTGGTAAKPVGLVYWAVAGADGVWAAHQVFPGSRSEVRRRSANAVLDLLRRRLLAEVPR